MWIEYGCVFNNIETGKTFFKKYFQNGDNKLCWFRQKSSNTKIYDFIILPRFLNWRSCSKPNIFRLGDWFFVIQINPSEIRKNFKFLEPVRFYNKLHQPLDQFQDVWVKIWYHWLISLAFCLKWLHYSSNKAEKLYLNRHQNIRNSICKMVIAFTRRLVRLWQTFSKFYQLFNITPDCYCLHYQCTLSYRISVISKKTTLVECVFYRENIFW